MGIEVNEYALRDRVDYLVRCASQSLTLVDGYRVVDFDWELDQEAAPAAVGRLEAMGWDVLPGIERFLAKPPEAT